MKNKARLSEMTAFSFGYQHKHLKIHQYDRYKRVTIRVLLLCFASLNETPRSSPIPIITTPFMTMKWRPSPEGGIGLFRLLVSV